MFAGWNLDMAEQVCADEQIPAGTVLDLMAALIDKSLVTFDHELRGESRYRLLDTIKEYAASRLAASGEEDALRLRHRDYLLRYGEWVVSQAFVRGAPSWPERVAMYRAITADLANYRLALATSLRRGDIAEGLRMCGAMRNPWVTHGDVTEGAEWFDQFLVGAAGLPPEVRGPALVFRGDLAFEQQDYPTVDRCAREGLELCRAAGDPHEAAALRLIAVATLRAGNLAEAVARIDEAVGHRPQDRQRLGGRAGAEHQGGRPGPPGHAARGPAHLRGRPGRAPGQQRVGRGPGPGGAGRGGPGPRRLPGRDQPLSGGAEPVPGNRRPAGDRPVPGRHRLGGAHPG